MAEKEVNEEKESLLDFLHRYINELIDKKLEHHDSLIKQEDAKEIVDHLMPELEKVVSKIVLKHLRAIGKYTLHELKEE
jgi:hypothetical protein